MILATAMTEPWMGLVSEGHLWGTGHAIQSTLGTFGLVILVTALSMGIFTGLNGFILSSSRLLFAMSRAKMLPEAFSRLHGKHKTPYVGIIFVAAVALLAPCFGREVLVWIVDMSSIGVSIAYFYTCFTAYKFFVWNKESIASSKHEVSPVKKVVALVGMMASLTFIGLLLIPGSPAFLGIESRIALIVWIVLGIMFYLYKRKEYNKIPEKDMDYLIFGENGKDVKEEELAK